MHLSTPDLQSKGTLRFSSQPARKVHNVGSFPIATCGNSASTPLPLPEKRGHNQSLHIIHEISPIQNYVIKTAALKK
jgi:hypothetical protein